jgi:hypothetical protein
MLPGYATTVVSPMANGIKMVSIVGPTQPLRHICITILVMCVASTMSSAPSQETMGI